MPLGSIAQPSQEWAVLFYLCGHYNRAGGTDPFVSALDDIHAVGATKDVAAAAYLDLESGARRVALRPGEPVDSEVLGPVNSGDPKTLEQFLAWAFDACPARRYVLVMAGLGILDADSVVGRPPFDSARTFAICDDRATDDAIELHELSATLRTAFPADGSRRLVLLACDLYALQFMEVAYELRGVVELMLGIQPDERHDAPPLRQWPYGQLLRRWQELLAAPGANARPRWRSGADPRGLTLATETVAMLGEHYTAHPGDGTPVTVSAINLQALEPLAQALDTFSVVYLQWLSSDVIWAAREKVFQKHRQMLRHAWSYDLDAVARAIGAALGDAAAEAPGRWASETLPELPYPRLSHALRVLGAAARELANGGSDPVCRALADEIAACRSTIEREISATAARTEGTAVTPHDDVVQAVRRLFVVDDPDGHRMREPGAWTAIIAAARGRFIGAQAGELADIFDGIEAAKQLAGLARRVSDLTRGADSGQQPAIAAVWPPDGRCGLSLYRPIDLDKLAESNYLHLRFSRELHWTALLTAVDLINNHARMLWRLLESQLTAAPLEARYQLMRRLAGTRALTGRHADQLRVLSAPDALFLTIEPIDAPASSGAAAQQGNDPTVSYRVRLSSLDRSSTVVECRNPVTRVRLERVLEQIDALGNAVDTQPAQTLERLARCGSLLGDDILYGISERLGEVKPSDGRAIHLVLQMPRELMQYPWELLRDRHGWLVERFAIGRQVIADADSIAQWGPSTRRGPLRLLVVAPSAGGNGAELAGVGVREGERVAECFQRLQERLPGLVEPADFRRCVNRPMTVEDFRTLMREGRYDIVHFAGHGRYDAASPHLSCWIFSDEPLYAFELRHTLANAEVTPWLVYGSACEGGRDGMAPRGYHGGVYGMASAALGQGVAAYIAPLWKIREADATNLASAFYEALLLRRASVGEALAIARRSVREGQPNLYDLVANDGAGDPEAGSRRAFSAGWTGMVLYGDPTPTVLQRLSPSDSGTAVDAQEGPAAAAPTTSIQPGGV